MLNLAEYRKKTAGLCDYLPWACLIGPGIVLNKENIGKTGDQLVEVWDHDNPDNQVVD